VMFSVVARRYAMIEGFLPPVAAFKDAVSSMSLERILQIALVLFLAGMGGAIWALNYWADLGFGAIQYSNVMRILIISLTAVVVAVQAAASAFLASIFSIRA
jgi:hypothetical protein